MGLIDEDAVVPTAVGELGALIRPHPAGVAPGVVFVDGSGDGARDEWGGWPDRLESAGVATLRHDKPGCGGSPGHWSEQTLEDRARESLAALRVLRGHPSVTGRPVGFYGVSQGGWVALLAAALAPDEVDFVITHSGPGTTPAAQERERLEAAVRAEGHDEAAVAAALAWVDERAGLVRRGDSPASILETQSRVAGEPWFGAVSFPYDSVEALRFLAGMIDFDPVAVLPDVRCPVLALFGGADGGVPVAESVAIYATHLPRDPRHGLAVFPNADHGLFLPADGDEERSPLAPAWRSTVAGFLSGLGD